MTGADVYIERPVKTRLDVMKLKPADLASKSEDTTARPTVRDALVTVARRTALPAGRNGSGSKRIGAAPTRPASC